MIGRIAGIILHRASDHVLVDVRGVGYIVHVSQRTAAALPPAGQAVALYTDLMVREDLLQLFGFTSLLEKEWHRLLTSVQGVGAKVSLAILGALGPEGVSRAIVLGDVAAIRAAPGVGPKLAQRIVNELKDKAPGVMSLGGELSAEVPPVKVTQEGSAMPAPEVAPAPPNASASATADALSALINLGYTHGDAASAVARAAQKAPEADTARLIHAALKLLAPKT